ncbi:MAG: hypothetical protein WKF91_08390 [Segetibacter sp.]
MKIFGLQCGLTGQEFQPLTFNDQPVLEQGISIEPYALFYENPTGDTAQPLSEVAQQQFIPIASTSDTKFNNARQMKQTSQVIWLQFQIGNTHPTDTLRLWYHGGVHAFISLNLKDKTS